MTEAIAHNSTTTKIREPARLSLSGRLLLLTCAFVMLAEVLIFAPSIARFRVDYLRDKLAQAHLVLTALEASHAAIDPELRDRLLDQAGMLGMTVIRPNMPPRTLGPKIPARIPMLSDLRTAMFWDLIGDALGVLLRGDNMIFGVTDVSPADPEVVVEAILEEAPMRTAMRAYAVRILALSIFISVTTAALVYASIQWLAVRPLRRITESMTAFRRGPEDQARVIVPDDRHDEVGVAEHALAAMQTDLRTALAQKERLAAVGTAVTKIAHDLKNILATAMLESERLANSSDAETRVVTGGIARAIDRAVELAKSTLRYAEQGLPQVRRKVVVLADLLNDVCRAVQPGLGSCRIVVAATPDLVATVDRDLLQRALENLVRNAAEAGATDVRIVADATTIEVIDNGPGLPKRALDSLFVAFAGSARPGGSGLGLPIARESLRAQGGDVTLRATSAAGAGFVIRLPR